MGHHDRVPKLDTQQRSLLHQMSAGELLTLVIGPLKAKVAELGLEEPARELLELLEMERASQRSCTAKKHPKLPCIRKTMTRMSIAGLIGVAGHSQTGAEFRAKLLAAVDQLRRQLH